MMSLIFFAKFDLNWIYIRIGTRKCYVVIPKTQQKWIENHAHSEQASADQALGAR